MSRINIHIGLPKTGTTYIQRNIFPLLPNTEVIKPTHLQHKFLKVNINKQMIISDELISGRLWASGGANEFYFNIDRMKHIFNKPKIIFGIRNQHTLLTSVYKQYLHEKGHKDINYFFDVNNNNGIVKHRDFLLMPKINYLLKNFEDVFIYSQGSLANRQDDFLVALAKFLGIRIHLETLNKRIESRKEKTRPNVGVKSEYQINTLKKLNKLSRKLEGWHPNLSLYSNFLRKNNLAPRYICQVRLKNVKSEVFDLSPEYKSFIDSFYGKDWDEASKLISY